MLQNNSIGMPVKDFTGRVYLWHRKYDVSIRTREVWEKESIIPPLKGKVVLSFTDGSNQTAAGAGTIIKRQKSEDIVIKTFLGKEASVYQAELIGINNAARELLDQEVKRSNIYIFCDNQAVLKSLSAVYTNSKLIKETYSLLNKLAGRNISVDLDWIPGHKGHEGNEEADKAAKEAAQLSGQGMEPFLPISINDMKMHINSEVDREHQRRWAGRTDCRQTKEWLSTPVTKARRKELLMYKKPELRLITGIITGHNTLNRHLNQIGLKTTPECDKCGKPETARHFIAECPALCMTRIGLWGKHTIDQDGLPELGLNSVMKYIKQSKRFANDNK